MGSAIDWIATRSAGGNLAERPGEPVLLFQNGRKLALIVRLFVDPFAQNFLLGSHLLNKLLDPVREVEGGSRCCAGRRRE